MQRLIVNTSLDDMSSLPNETWRWNAVDVANQIRIGAISSYEAVRSCFDRIEKTNPTLNAIVYASKEKAFEGARSADNWCADGKHIGLLHDAPIPVKMNVNVQGEATTKGVPAFTDRIASVDIVVVANLRNAGAIIIGSTNTPPCLFRWLTENPLNGRTQNLWSTEITYGGSSGGMGVAVSTGMCCVAHGTDLADSIRYPAYANGIIGLRTTTGRVSAYHPTSGWRRYGLKTISSQVPPTCTVGDARIALQAISASGMQDTTWVETKLSHSDDNLPVTVALADQIDGAPIRQRIHAPFNKTARSLEARGYPDEHANPPDLNEGVKIWQFIVMAKNRVSILAGAEAMQNPSIQRSLRNMAGCPPSVVMTDYMDAIAKRHDYRPRWFKFLHHYPLVFLPTSRDLSQKWDADLGSVDEMQGLLAAQSPLIAIASFRLPGIQVPTGVSNGISVVALLVSASFREMCLLVAAEAIEEAMRAESGNGSIQQCRRSPQEFFGVNRACGLQ